VSSVVVCFAEADRDIAERLATALERAGVAMWRSNGALIAAESASAFPQFDPEPGDMAALLALWTPAARQSPWVRDVTRAALGYAKLVNVTAGVAAAPFPYGQAVTYPLDDWLAGRDDLADLERDLRARLAEDDEPFDEPLDGEPEPPGFGPPPQDTESAIGAAGDGDLLNAPGDTPLAAAVAGGAPGGPSPPPQAWDDAPPLPVSPPPRAAPPPEVRATMPESPGRAPPPARSRPARRWALLAGGAVAVVGALAAGVAFTSLSAPHPTGPHAPVATEPETGAPATPGPSPVEGLAQTAVGRWATKAGACDRPAEITLSNGQLTLRLPDGTAETGVIMADTADTFAVETSGGAVTYTVAGDELTKSGGANGPVSFTRCPAAAGNAVDNAARSSTR
jgi:hypothetical protein